MRILVLSDIHGNIDALEAIDETHDRILFLGDVVDYGPDPIACIDFLKQNNALRVRGNHDNAVANRVDCGCGEAFRHLSVLTRQYMWQILGEEQLQWLGAADTFLEMWQTDRSVYATHAAPSDNLFKYLPPDTPDEELELEGVVAGADIVLTGHTHKPFAREAGGRLIVNVGSVGQPRDCIPRASYAIIERGQVELKRVDYDVERAAARVMALPIDAIAREQLAYILRNAQEPPAE